MDSCALGVTLGLGSMVESSGWLDGWMAGSSIKERIDNITTHQGLLGCVKKAPRVGTSPS